MKYFHGISLNLKRRCNGYLSIGTSTHQASEGWFPRRLSPVPLREETAFTIESSFTCHGDKEVTPVEVLETNFSAFISSVHITFIHFLCTLYSFLLFRSLISFEHAVFISSVPMAFTSVHTAFISSVHTTFISYLHIYSFLQCTAHLFISSVHTTFISSVHTFGNTIHCQKLLSFHLLDLSTY